MCVRLGLSRLQLPVVLCVPYRSVFFCLLCMAIVLLTKFMVISCLPVAGTSLENQWS